MVRLRVTAGPSALAATGQAIAVMAQAQCLMSFHDADSELAQLNRGAAFQPTPVSDPTFAVLRVALRLAGASGGVFDPTVAPLAVRAGTLPRPERAPEPDPAASWRDVELDPLARTVRFRRPLWLDLGGVAKGYAVDAAVHTLRRMGVAQGCVNAGGDLRVFGPEPELVALDTGAPGAARRGLSVANASVASSGGLASDPRARGELAAHLDGCTRRAAPRRFVAVLARRCVHADALTKVVLARGPQAEPLLGAFRARAAVCSSDFRWLVLGGAYD